MESRLTDLGFSRLARLLVKFIASKTMVAAKAGLARSGDQGEDQMPAAFQPEVLLPVQYNDMLRRKRLLHGERLLMSAVLEDAVESYMKYLNSPARKGQKRFAEAEEWIDRDDPQWLFSFDNVCEALDIDPTYMRSGLHRWKQAHFKVPVGENLGGGNGHAPGAN